MNSKRFLFLPASAALVAALTLAGCHKQQGDGAQGVRGPNEDAALAQPDSKVDQKMVEAQQAARASGQELKEAGKEAAAELRQAGSQISDRVTDAVITTSVTEELSKDQRLVATKIDVDTTSGRVALRGTAPDAAARDRATQLALGVKGVVSVDNQLVVRM
jgi:hyperosmotically inducible protein